MNIYDRRKVRAVCRDVILSILNGGNESLSAFNEVETVASWTICEVTINALTVDVSTKKSLTPWILLQRLNPLVVCGTYS